MYYGNYGNTACMHLVQYNVTQANGKIISHIYTQY